VTKIRNLLNSFYKGINFLAAFAINKDDIVFYLEFGSFREVCILSELPGMGADDSRRSPVHLGLGHRPDQAGVHSLGSSLLGLHMPRMDAGY
jgi:hypothetical protein